MRRKLYASVCAFALLIDCVNESSVRHPLQVFLYEGPGESLMIELEAGQIKLLREERTPPRSGPASEMQVRSFIHSFIHSFIQ